MSIFGSVDCRLRRDPGPNASAVRLCWVHLIVNRGKKQGKSFTQSVPGKLHSCHIFPCKYFFDPKYYCLSFYLGHLYLQNASIPCVVHRSAKGYCDRKRTLGFEEYFRCDKCRRDLTMKASFEPQMTRVHQVLKYWGDIFEHTCAYARWAVMHRFLSVRLWLDQNSDLTKIQTR